MDVMVQNQAAASQVQKLNFVLHRVVVTSYSQNIGQTSKRNGYLNGVFINRNTLHLSSGAVFMLDGDLHRKVTQ